MKEDLVEWLRLLRGKSLRLFTGKALKNERRAEPRYDLDLPLAYCRWKSTEECGSIASHISNRGFCLQNSRELVRGDIIKFELEVGDDSVQGEAKIEWTKSLNNVDPSRTPFCTSGCRIIAMATRYRSILKSYLNGRSLQEV